ERREVLQGRTPLELGRALTELVLEAHGTPVARRLDVEPLREPRRRELERAVLQQPREEQVARLERRDVLRVDELALRQESDDLEVEQRRRDADELARAVELLGPVDRADILDELVRDDRERDLRDVELVLGDEAQQ